MAKKKFSGDAPLPKSEKPARKRAPKSQSEQASRKRKLALVGDDAEADDGGESETQVEPDDPSEAFDGSGTASLVQGLPGDDLTPRWWILQLGSRSITESAIRCNALEIEAARAGAAKKHRGPATVRPALNTDPDRALVLAAGGDPDDLGSGNAPTAVADRMKLIEVKQRAIVRHRGELAVLKSKRKGITDEIARLEAERDELIAGQGALPFGEPKGDDEKPDDPDRDDDHTDVDDD